VSNIDQHRFNNQRSGFISARQAAKLLDVKLPTLYAYVSRGLVRSVPGDHDRRRLYSRADVDRLKARRDARRGHGAVAAGALRWGEPVLDSGITQITSDGPSYRGRLAIELAANGEPFEAVAELLWTGELPTPTPSPWPSPRRLPSLRTLLGASAGPCDGLSVAVPICGSRDLDRHSFDLPRARVLVRTMAASLGGTGDSVAATLLDALGGRGSKRSIAAMQKALVVIADHELNVSTFACRVAASTGADLYASVSAGLAALSGPRHGGMCDRVEALLDECGSASVAPRVVRERTRRGDSVPGFGHPLYPEGDPRGSLLMAEATDIAVRSRRVATAAAVASTMARADKGTPNVDFALVSLAGALRLRPGAAAVMFAVGRSAGWIAHAIEQREAGFMLRPRARYVSTSD